MKLAAFNFLAGLLGTQGFEEIGRKLAKCNSADEVIELFAIEKPLQEEG